MPERVMTASIAHPEGPERRAEITRRLMEETGLDDAMLERLVRAFYARARVDPVIGAKFDVVEDWEHHIARISEFWSAVALMTGRYHGQPLAAHVPLDVRGPHFDRWLQLWETTVREICPERALPYLMDKARRIAASLEMGTSVARGELPGMRATA